MKWLVASSKQKAASIFVKNKEKFKVLYEAKFLDKLFFVLSVICLMQ